MFDTIINPKIFYRFVEFTSRLLKYDLAHEDYKMIALNKKEANTIIEKKVKRLSDSFMYLINQTSQIIDLEIIETSYFILTKKKITNNNSKRILENIYLNLEEDVYVRCCMIIFLICGDMKLERKLEFSLLLVNFILLKENKYPIIFHENDKKTLKMYIKMRFEKELIEMIFMHEFQTRESLKSSNTNVVKIILDEVALILTNNKQKISNEFNVKHMFIYGSLAKQNTHKNSDIDLLVYMDNNLLNYAKYKKIKELKEFLIPKLGIDVDIIDFTHALLNSEIKEVSNAIKIF